MDRKRQKLTPGKTKRKLKLSTPETTSQPSNLHFICNKEVVIQLEKLSDSVVAEMTAGGSALPPEQAKKKLKLSTTKSKLHTSNPHFICDKEVVIQLEKLSDSFIAEMTADGSALPPEQVNESNVDALDINSFPNEIILNVFGYLEQNQMGQIARVCRRWNVLTKSAVLWRKVNVKIFSSGREKNAVAKSFINGLPSCVTFIRLDFSECEDSIHVDFEKLCVELQQNCPHLEELILTHLKISNIIPEVIQLCTQFLQDVKKLVFHRCSFSDYSATVEFDGTSKIEVLDLSYCDFGHFNKPQFEGLLYLKKLRLNSTNVDDTWFRDYTSFWNQLHVLDLGWTPITASTIVAIQNYGLNLKELYLCWVYLQDSDLHFNFSVFSHLQTICLSCTGVTCEDVVSFIQSCSSLKNVYVDECVAESFAAHPFVVANRCKSVIVKAIDWDHDHDVDYSHN